MKVTYTLEQKQHAIKTYNRLKSYSQTLRVLGYPSRHVLFDWVNKRNHRSKSVTPRSKYKHYSWSFKLDAVEKAIGGESVHDIAKELDITNAAIVYRWIRNWRLRGVEGLMSKKEKLELGIYKTRAQLKDSLPDDVNELKNLAAKLIAEKAVLEQELELVKKSEGSIPKKLHPKQKSLIVNNLRQHLPLELLFEVLKLKPSSYYYACSAAKRPDKYKDVCIAIHKISKLSKYTYGSPRIWTSLRNQEIYVSEKVVRRLMKEEKIEVRYAKRKRKYSSYVGEITPAVENLVKGNFHAARPNELWLTDITEFAAADGKVYVSPMIDCLDGKVVAWETSRHPDYALVDRMLDKAIATLDTATLKALKDDKNPKKLIIHNDRGGHYRGGRWIERLEGLGITRSMSRKGNSGDNAACEGFFGRMKTEMYYGLRWSSISALEKAIDEYIDFYNNERIKISLGGISIRDYRNSQEKLYRKTS